MPKLPPILWLAAFVALSSCARGDEVVYKRQLPNHQTLVVTRHVATDVPPYEPLPPGFTYPKVDHVYDYDFTLSSSSIRGQPIKMWTYQFYSYSDSDLPWLPTDLQILDAAVQEQTLIVVYKESNKTWGGTTFANVITKTASQPGWQALPRNDTELVTDSDIHQVYITAATISGLVKDQTLSLSLKNVHSTVKYRLINSKWIKDAAVPDAEANQKPAAQ